MNHAEGGARQQPEGRMRPPILAPLLAPVTALKGVGPRIAASIERLVGTRVADLLWHLPTGMVDRTVAPSIAAAPDGAVATIKVTVDEHRPGGHRRPYRVACSDECGALVVIVFFHVQGDYPARALPVGAERIVSGKVETYGGVKQITHPDYILPVECAGELPGFEPVYGLTEGLNAKALIKAVAGALDRVPALPEWQDPAWRATRGWPAWDAAVRSAHAPRADADLSPTGPVRARLAYDELLASQLALLLVRSRNQRQRGRVMCGDGDLRAALERTLPYRLTGAQRRAIAEILADMAAPRRMMRLLHGDVGAGKTAVALSAMLGAVEAGAQAAFMAPTELLARQHHQTLSALCAPLGVSVGLLTGREKGNARAQVLAGLAEGALGILVATHAVLEETVRFRDLGLAVIDEQHRFGVEQRMLLSGKGTMVDTLVMTATPIPRTLALTAYGDLDVSRLDEKPPGRLPVDTRTLPVSRLDEVVAAVSRQIAQGGRVYWVCPLVGESEVLDIAAAEARHAELRGAFGATVGLVHGRMRGSDKDRVMAAFQAGDISVLVATTVIEVGVDVPAATVMVIEHAERFGLAQLHQLRGRIGRGAGRSVCLLLYQGPLGETAQARLRILRETEDGFRIAEEDLRLRGAGELLGTRQTGLPDFRLADLDVHADLLAAAHDDARLILERDPDLAGPRGQALRVLLYLFARDEAVRYLRTA
jgi:ATP-dependent DNA helicase RecG